MYWYRTQTVCVKWGKLNSGYCGISNGVRQGDIRSLKLFSIYVDELPKTLFAAKTGSIINDISINHVMYADDLCIMIASISGFQN